jgi:2-oxoglutarate ferredoxin oxidoreductase subunit gamma
MDRPSLVRLQHALDGDALVMINSSLVRERPRRKSLRVYPVPANIVMLGAFIEVDHLVSADSVKRALRQMLPERRHRMIALNERALERGMQYIREGK